MHNRRWTIVSRLETGDRIKMKTMIRYLRDNSCDDLKCGLINFNGDFVRLDFHDQLCESTVYIEPHVGVNYGIVSLMRQKERENGKVGKRGRKTARSECAVVSVALYAICAALRPSAFDRYLSWYLLKERPPNATKAVKLSKDKTNDDVSNSEREER